MSIEQAIAEELKRVYLKVANEGWVSYEELKADCPDIMYLDKTLSIMKAEGDITETTSQKKQGVQWAGNKSAGTKKHIQEILKKNELKGAKQREKPWKDWVSAEMTIKLTSPTLAGKPLEKPNMVKEEKRQMVFERNEAGEIVFRDGHWRGLLGQCIEYVPGFPKYGKDKIGMAPHPIRANGELTKITRICPSGSGFTYHEALKPGTELKVDVMIPTSRISIDDFAQMMALGGKFKGFSVAGHNQGYGRFELLEIK